MDTPVVLGLIALVAFGVDYFCRKIASANGVYPPSYMLIQGLTFSIWAALIHIAQNNVFDLSVKMTGLAALASTFGTIGVLAVLLAFRLGGQGSTIVPLVGLGVMVAVPLSFIVYNDPLTAAKLLGLGLSAGSIVLLSR